MRLLRVCLPLLFVLTHAFPTAWGKQRPLAPVPREIASNHFLVSIDGQQTPVMHAALNLYFLNFEAGKHKTISVTAPTDDFWSAGVEIEPWRLGIRPKREGRTITFSLNGPAKISISRPGDFLTQAEMLYLFANAKEKVPKDAALRGMRVIGPGAHTENIDARTGETIYLAPGAVVFGSLDLWGVDHVKVFGPGVIVYDGPQNPADDDGWMHKRNWHCIVMDNAHDIEISDVTCVVRSRTWQIQMKDSRRIVYDNLKVIGANAGNANADGMDWLGGGDTLVRNSFFRAADDIFALQTSWEGYGEKAFAVQGEPVTNVRVEDSVLSTSISNIVRVAWPRKNFEGGNFSMQNSDVLHMGLGGCGVPFALMELWADPSGRGQSADYRFDDIRLEHWYSLVNVQQPTAVRGVHFTDIAGLATPSLVPSMLKGDVAGVTLDNVVLAGERVETAAGVPVEVSEGAEQAAVVNTGPKVRLNAPRGWLRPGQALRFEAEPEDPSAKLRYTWIFGDGKTANGRKVKHRFADEDGTLLDGSGLYRVLLHVSSENGRQTWVEAPTLVREKQSAALSVAPGAPGAVYRLTSAGGGGATGSEAATVASGDAAEASSGTAKTLSLTEVPHPAANYTLAFSADVDAPEDGAYLFTMVANDASSISIDGRVLGTSPKPFAQVCGLAGNAARPVVVATELAKGVHHLEIEESHGTGIDNFQVFWQGPGIGLSHIPPERLSHR